MSKTCLVRNNKHLLSYIIVLLVSKTRSRILIITKFTQFTKYFCDQKIKITLTCTLGSSFDSTGFKSSLLPSPDTPSTSSSPSTSSCEQRITSTAKNSINYISASSLRLLPSQCFHLPTQLMQSFPLWAAAQVNNNNNKPRGYMSYVIEGSFPYSLPSYLSTHICNYPCKDSF